MCAGKRQTRKKDVRETEMWMRHGPIKDDRKISCQEGPSKGTGVREKEDEQTQSLKYHPTEVLTIEHTKLERLGTEKTRYSIHDKMDFPNNILNSL